MSTAPCLLLAAAPDAPGARETVDRALAGEERVIVLLTEAGLAWADEDALREAHEAGRAEVSLCTVSARDRNWTPASAPDWIAWSGLAVWLLRHADAGQLWAVTP